MSDAAVIWTRASRKSENFLGCEFAARHRRGDRRLRGTWCRPVTAVPLADGVASGVWATATNVATLLAPNGPRRRFAIPLGTTLIIVTRGSLSVVRRQCALPLGPRKPTEQIACCATSWRVRAACRAVVPRRRGGTCACPSPAGARGASQRSAHAISYANCCMQTRLSRRRRAVCHPDRRTVASHSAAHRDQPVDRPRRLHFLLRRQPRSGRRPR